MAVFAQARELKRREHEYLVLKHRVEVELTLQTMVRELFSRTGPLYSIRREGRQNFFKHYLPYGLSERNSHDLGEHYYEGGWC